jgi:hypothetical protein
LKNSFSVCGIGVGEGERGVFEKNERYEKKIVEFVCFKIFFLI